VGSGNSPGAAAPDVVERHAQELFDQARALVGDRFAEARVDPDRGLRVTIIDLDVHDVSAINAVAERLGVAEWVRIERADPSALEAWERLRHDLRRLAGARRSVLTHYPMPDPGYRRPPVAIHVAADAEATAAELHAAYGDFVSLMVGALPYPPTENTPDRATSPRRPSEQRTPDPSELTVTLDGCLSIRAGQSVTHDLLLTNLSDHDIRIHTNGHLTASIVDDSGAVVGGYSGGQHLPLVIFTAEPAHTVRVPLLVGTASFVPDLGYTVPPGTWHLTASIELSDGRRLTTPPLELTITP